MYFIHSYLAYFHNKSLLNYTLLFSWLNSTVSVCVDLTDATNIKQTARSDKTD